MSGQFSSTAGVSGELLSHISDILADSPALWAGTYGSRVGGWETEDSDLDLVIGWPDSDEWPTLAGEVRGEIMDIGASERIEVNFAQGRWPSLFEVSDDHPERLAFFFVGDTLAGDPAKVASASVLDLAARARTRTSRAALAAAKRAWSNYYAWPIVISDLAHGFGYLRCNGKDRRSDDEIFDGLLITLRPTNRALIERSLVDPSAYRDNIDLSRLVGDLINKFEALVQDHLAE